MQPRLRWSFERSAQPHSHPPGHVAADHPHRHTRRGRKRPTTPEARCSRLTRAACAAAACAQYDSQRLSYGSATLIDGAPAQCPRPYTYRPSSCVSSRRLGGMHCAQSTGQCGWCGNNVCLCATHCFRLSLRDATFRRVESNPLGGGVCVSGVQPFASIPTPRLTRSSAQARRPC